MTDPLSLPQSGEEALQQLLARGLSQESPDNPASYCKLLQVLFEHCILKPLAKAQPVSPTTTEQVELTLTILQRQTAARPELLACTIPGDENATPLYKWILPRLIFAAVKYEDLGLMADKEGRKYTEDLVAELLLSASRMISVMCRDVENEGGPSYVQGPRRAVQVLDHLLSFCEGTVDRKSTTMLYEYGDLSIGDVAFLMTLDIILKSDVYFSDDAKLVASRMLADSATRFRTASASKQARYAKTLTGALDSDSYAPMLRKACVVVSNWPVPAVTAGPDIDAWRNAMSRLFQAIGRTDEDTRAEVWWTLIDEAEAGTLNVTDSPDVRKIEHLLTPVSGILESEQIKAIVPDERLDEWRHRTAHSTALAQVAVRECLVRLEAGQAGPSRKRKRHNDQDDELLRRVRKLLPDLNINEITDILPSVSAQMRRATGHEDGTLSIVIKLIPDLLAVLQDENGKISNDLADLLQILRALMARMSDDADLIHHTATTFKVAEPRNLVMLLQLQDYKSIVSNLWNVVKSDDRRKRVMAGRAISIIYSAQDSHPQPKVAANNRKAILAKISQTSSSPPRVQETAILLFGELARLAREEDLGDVLEPLIQRLGSHSAPLRSVAYTQILSLCETKEKAPYNLISPYLERISTLLAKNVVKHPDIVAETMSLIGYTRKSFFSMTLRYTIPVLVMVEDRQALETIASVVGQALGFLLFDHAGDILSKIFLCDRVEPALQLLVNMLRELTSYDVTVESIMTSCAVPFIVSMVVELGDEDRRVADNALNALKRAHREFGRAKGSSSADLGAFLKPHMLGIISQLNERLHDLQGKKSVEEKQKIIRSISQLIARVGDSMSSFSPQIIASLQSTLGIPELRYETLQAWKIFVETLRYADIGPFVGRTTGAIAANWSILSLREREVAIRIVAQISDNAKHHSAYRDEIVGLESIPELRNVAKHMISYRKDWSTSESITNLLGRTTSKNIAVATASMRELRDVLCNQQGDIIQLSRGDMFDPLVSQITRTLMLNATRDGDCEEVKDLSYECIGIIGALDPDRILPLPEKASVSLHSNFADHEESTEFAVHLIRDVLVDAFRATNDTKHQSYLAYAIQELLKFCGFNQKVLSLASTNVPVKVRTRWATIPKDQHETLAPLLESRFELHVPSPKPAERPVYPSTTTYREWLQKWTTDLIGQIMSLTKTDRGAMDCKTVFGVFRGILRSQDVAVAHHILPYLVLTLLLLGEEHHRVEICAEINTVLQDQVNSFSPATADKRMLSSQVIFDLMDYLSKWLRQSRVSKSSSATTDRHNHVKAIEDVLSSIESELMANAALQSKAYARSLRSFEQRLYQLKRSQRLPDGDLQEYYERIHQIYAELDEPDGMEGISTFVIAPSLEHQIREHESTGRWTSAQSCWEVRLQQSPDDVHLHVGLLKCLRNLGHYDTLRTHIRGVLSRTPAWSDDLSTFEAEAAWIIGDWDTVEQVGERGPPISQVLLAAHQRNDIGPAIKTARRDLGRAINSHSFARSYDPILQLHLLREIEMIHTTDHRITSIRDPVNRGAISQNNVRVLHASLGDRFDTAAPAFRVREAILSMRRTALNLATTPLLKPDIGLAWITSSKIARKAGYEQTAYSATLQAQQVDAPFTFLQQAKLSRVHGGAYKALTELENAVQPLLNQPSSDQGHETEEDFTRDRNLAKAVLCEARWANETDRFDANEIIGRYQQAIALASSSESPYYHLGHYYDTITSTSDTAHRYHYHTVNNYIQALTHGVKYIYRTMPRLLTIWLDLGEKDLLLRKSPEAAESLRKISRVIDASRKTLPMYQYLTAFPQLVSRILHPENTVSTILHKIIATVIQRYPHQALWPMVGVMQSKRPDRSRVCQVVLTRAQAAGPFVTSMVRDAQNLSRNLLRLADDKVEDSKRQMSISSHYAYVTSVFPSKMIMPLQDALTCTLPSTSDTVQTHNPFPGTLVEINGIEDKVDVMPSLQRPKKLVFQGSDGKKYPFLCKPHDDLRKDARLMDFNAMINKLLKSASESRRRQLYIRTYAVMPLNEECGLLEWVVNTNALKNILEKGYQRHNKRIWPSELPRLLENARKHGSAYQVKQFKETVLPMFAPTVFYDWFLVTWPEPSAWLASRLAYSRTLAVMSMIGYVLGLGDRHGENILFDSLTGDTVHVDLNCLFDKGKTFEIPEKVPFRLTHNMVEAMGVTGVEGVFRKAAEISLSILRNNSESLMTVLEAFVHDPLVEWTKHRKTTDVRATGEKNLGPIKKKLAGHIQDKGIDKMMTVPNQVDWLIKQATSPNNLALMYQGWASWL